MTGWAPNFYTCKNRPSQEAPNFYTCKNRPGRVPKLERQRRGTRGPRPGRKLKNLKGTKKQLGKTRTRSPGEAEAEA